MSLRITGGEWRGRSISVPDAPLRPTQSKIRQSLFNQIQGLAEGAVVLDLFSGTGALGFEALSRGASKVHFVEQSPRAARSIEKNIESFECGDRARVWRMDLERGIDFLSGLSFDLIFIDPPYDKGWERKILNQINEAQSRTTGPLLIPGGIIFLECSKRTEFSPPDVNQWTQMRISECRVYGDTKVVVVKGSTSR